MVDTSSAEAVFKEFFEPGAREELDNSNLLLAQVEKNSEDVEGNSVVSLQHLGRNNGTGYRKEDEQLPQAKSQRWERAKYFLYASYGSGSITTRLVKSIKTDRGGFVKAAEKEMSLLKNDIKRNVNFHIWNDSTGVIATFAANSTTNTLNLSASTDLRQSLAISRDMDIDIGTVASPTSIADNRTITAVNYNSNGIVTSIVIDGAPVTTLTTSKLFKHGEGGSGADQRVLTGVQTSISDTGTYAGIDRSTEFLWRSYVKNVGGPLTEKIVQQVMGIINSRGGSSPNLVVTTHDILIDIGSTILNRSELVNPTTLKGGFDGVSVYTPWGNITFVADRDCPAGNVFFFSTKDMVQYQYNDWEFLDDDSSILHLVPDYARYNFTMEKFHELAIEEPKSFARLTGVTTS